MIFISCSKGDHLSLKEAKKKKKKKEEEEEKPISFNELTDTMYRIIRLACNQK